MTSYGKVETETLKENLHNQLDRLLEQLTDLDNSKDELDSAEYEETREDTLEQLKEFNERLKRIVNGDVSLVSTLGAMQLATQAAISQAFRTPEVIRLFGRREPKQLRDRIKTVEQDFNLGKLNSEAKDRQIAEILTALRQLGEQLSTQELQFLDKHNDISNTFKSVEFEAIN